jgi:hypothetical protein
VLCYCPGGLTYLDTCRRKNVTTSQTS